VIQCVPIERALVPERVVEAGRGDAGLRHQVPDRGGVIPSLPKAQDRRVQYGAFVEFPRSCGDAYTIADISAWGWLDRASRVRKGEDDPLAQYPHLKRLFQTVDARPAVQRARAVGKDHGFKTVNDDETKRSLFPSNYPPTA
jgi:hypothetical protein